MHDFLMIEMPSICKKWYDKWLADDIILDEMDGVDEMNEDANDYE